MTNIADHDGPWVSAPNAGCSGSSVSLVFGRRRQDELSWMTPRAIWPQEAVTWAKVSGEAHGALRFRLVVR